MIDPSRRQFLAASAAALAARRAAADVPRAVREAEARRITVVAKVTPAVVAVCKPGGEASGSGVLIDPDGYALTNFHVTDDVGPVHTCGLPDGELYDSVLVGHDPVGDLAMVKLLPREKGKPFPAVPLGDSDAVRPGDWSLALGNPFGIARDFTPSVTFGLISGTHRYQPPAGDGILEYTDCLQFDTSINPGNSGGPLFNLLGELIGINGRGQFDKRGRINSGAGFAISVNQCKHFLLHLRAGLHCDHATLGASVESDAEGGDLARMLVRQILEDSDAYRRGLREGDRLVRFAGRPLTSTNHYKNVLGIHPAGWRLPLVYRRGNEQKEVRVRTQPTREEDRGDDRPEQPKPPRPPKKGPQPKEKPKTESPAAKLYEAKPGFANFHFNKLERDRLLAGFRKVVGDPAGYAGAWTLTGRVQLVDREGPFTLTLADAADGTETKLARGAVVDAVKPLKADQPVGELLLPTGSGGLLATLYLWRRLLALGEKGFEGLFAHGGLEPFYPAGAGGEAVRCEVLRTKHAAFEAKWFFRPADTTLAGVEATFSKDEDPCELVFGDDKPAAGGTLPHRVEARFGDKRYGVFTVAGYKAG
jgi:S1-C subfamily serine protease